MGSSRCEPDNAYVTGQTASSDFHGDRIERVHEGPGHQIPNSGCSGIWRNDPDPGPARNDVFSS
jgi:hypothetical protein